MAFKAVSAEQAIRIWEAILRENFEPAIRAEVEQMTRHTVEKAKMQMEREILGLVDNLKVHINALSEKFKTSGVDVLVSVDIPEEWEERYGRKAQ